jgi:hypothetical protein
MAQRELYNRTCPKFDIYQTRLCGFCYVGIEVGTTDNRNPQQKCLSPSSHHTIILAYYLPLHKLPILNFRWTTSMEQRPSEFNSHAAGQEYPLFYMEFKGSLPWSQKPNTGSYPEPDAYIPSLRHCLTFHKKLLFYKGLTPTQPPNWRSTPCWLSITAYVQIKIFYQHIFTLHKTMTMKNTQPQNAKEEVQINLLYILMKAGNFCVCWTVCSCAICHHTCARTHAYVC